MLLLLLNIVSCIVVCMRAGYAAYLALAYRVNWYVLLTLNCLLISLIPYYVNGRVQPYCIAGRLIYINYYLPSTWLAHWKTKESAYKMGHLFENIELFSSRFSHLVTPLNKSVAQGNEDVPVTQGRQRHQHQNFVRLFWRGPSTPSIACEH